MDSIITFFCIIGLCIFVYGYITMRYKYRDYPHSCKTLYIPRKDSPVKDRLPHMEVLDHELNDIKFFPNQTSPRGISDIENIIPSLNQKYDSIELREIGG